MRPDLPYRNRVEAGRFLAGELTDYRAKEDVVVLGLTRGGVPVAAEVATALAVPLDALVVRKLGVPVQPELAMGALAPEETRVLDEQLIRALHLSIGTVEAVVGREQAELMRREQLYRSGRPPLDLKDRTVILVDDGLATGSTMLAAVQFARKLAPRRIVLAVPVASAGALEKLRPEVDECVCPATPEPFYSVGDWYWSFPPSTDSEVMELLEEGRRPAAAKAR
jgi:putative phosphoribosyl transferase